MNYYQHHIGDFMRDTAKIRSLPMVYALATSDLKLVKIGMTKSPRQRFINIQSACPFEVSLWLGIRTPIPRKVEKDLHKKLEKFKTKGEWFSLSDEMLDGLIEYFNKTNVSVRGAFNALL